MPRLAAPGENKAQDLVGMGQTAVYPAEFEVAVDGRESSARAVLSENLLEEAAGIGRKAIFGHELFPLVAVFVGGGAEPADGELGGELAREDINPATDSREGHGLGSPCLNGDYGIGGIDGADWRDLPSS